MGHKLGISIGIASFCAFSSISYAADQTNREIARTYADYYLQDKNYPAVQALLTDHLKQDPRDGWAWNLLGMTYLETGNVAYAIRSFQEASSTAFNDVRGIYLYNYADALVRSGDVAQARAALLKSAREEISSSSATTALSDLQAGHPLPPFSLGRRSQSGSWNLGVGIGAGYDSNVLLSSDSLVADGSATGTASPFGTVIPQIAYAKPMGGGLLELRSLSSVTYETSTEAEKFDMLYTSLAAEWGSLASEAPGLHFGVANLADVTWLGFGSDSGNGYYNGNESIGPSVSWRHDLHSETRLDLPVQYHNYALADGESPDDDRTGFGFRPALSYHHASGPDVFTLGIVYEHLWAHGINYIGDGLSIPLAWSRRLVWGLNGAISAEPFLTSYNQSLNGRHDQGLRVSLDLSRQFSQTISGAMDYTFRRSISNVDIATYSKHTITVMVNYGVF